MFAISCKKIFNRIIHKIIDQYYNDWPFGNDGVSLFWWRCDFRANMFFVNKLHDRLAATAAHAKAVLIVIIDHDTLFCAAMNTEIDGETPESVCAHVHDSIANSCDLIVYLFAPSAPSCVPMLCLHAMSV